MAVPTGTVSRVRRRSLTYVTPDNQDVSDESGDQNVDKEEPHCFAYEEYQDGCGQVLARKRDHSTTEAEPERKHLSFKFIYGMKYKMWVKRDYFEIDSIELIQVLNQALPGRFTPTPGSKKVRAYASGLFHWRLELANELQKLDLNEEADKCLSFRHVMQFLNKSWGIMKP